MFILSYAGYDCVPTINNYKLINKAFKDKYQENPEEIRFVYNNVGGFIPAGTIETFLTLVGD